MDRTTTLLELKNLVEQFVGERDWFQFHSSKNLSIAIAVEAAELMDLFKWHTDHKSTQVMRKAHTRSAAIDELADIVILSLAFANRYHIDLSQALRNKLLKNRRKYPARKYKGRY